MADLFKNASHAHRYRDCLLALSCTQAPGDINVTLDPTNITSYILGATQDSAIILYSTSSNYDGDFVHEGPTTYATARIGADALCNADRARAGRTCTTVHAVISLTSSTDEIASMASTYSLPAYPVKSPGGTIIGNNWADLLDSAIPQSLSSAGVAMSGYWSFSNANGTLHANNCSNGTSTAVGGQTGDSGSLSGTWLSSASQGCGNSFFLLCACY